ncbi:MAG: ATP-binding protein, partial [Spirochaetota bacterium]
GNPVSHYEFKIVHKGGDEKWVDFWAQPVQFRGEIAVLIAAIDITQRKNFEAKQKNLEEQLRHSQRLEAIGRLAGGVAHDFNNLLSPIMGYAELLTAEREGDIPLKRKLCEILKAAESAKALTGHLLAFSRKQLLQQNVINLNTLLDNFLMILKRTIRENIQIRLVPHTNLWNIMGDSSQIEQILMNMTINAQDAMPNGGDLIIETTNVTLDILYSDEYHQIEPGEYVLLTISDTGTGIDRETIENIFDPFYTTKPHGMGTGLGLSTVYGIVRQHRGHIHVYSEPGKGSTFKIYFPREKEEVTNARTDSKPDEIVSGDETILLVEDETMVREMTARVLQSIGYSIIEASSAEEALEKAGTYNGTLHLLLTDIIMQDMNGIDLYQRISSKRPGLKVLFMSGYNPDLLDSLDLLVSTDNYIQKPFSIKTLSTMIRNILSVKF